jgi:hypothetical protein
MVSHRLQLVLAVTALILLVGCSDPYRFSVRTPDAMDCRIFTGLHSAEGSAFGFTMQPDAVVGMTSLEYTQYEWRGFVNSHGGKGFRLLLRPKVEETVIDSGLVLLFSSGGGERLDSAGSLLESDPAFRFPQDSSVLVTVFTDEDYLQVTVGCDTVLRRKTMRMTSDDLVVQTLHGTTLAVYAPLWKRLVFPAGDHIRAGRDL